MIIKNYFKNQANKIVIKTFTTQARIQILRASIISSISQSFIIKIG